MRTLLLHLSPYLFAALAISDLGHSAYGKKGASAPNRVEAGTRPSQEEKATQLLSQGSTEIDRREYSAAYKTISAAYKAFPSADGLYLLCRLAIAEGKDVAVRDLCRRYLADPGHAEKPTIPHQSELAEALSKTIPPSGEVAVFGSLGALLYLDDRLVGSLPLSRPLLASAGQHRVALVEGEHRQEWPVKVLANRTVEMRFEPESSAVLVTQLPAVFLLFRNERLPEPLRARTQHAIEQAVQSAHFATLREGAAIVKSADLGQCISKPECLLDLAVQNNADYVLTATVSEFREDAAHKLTAQVELSFTEARARTKLISNDHVCTGCSPSQFSASTADAARGLLALGTGRARGELTVSANPKTAELVLDGASVGTGRYEGSLPIGVYSIVAQQKGFLSQRTTVLVEHGKSSSQMLTLIPKVPVYRSERSPRPLWRIITGSAVAALGVGLVGYGLSGIAIDGSCAEQGPTGVCRQIFGSKGTGIAFSAIGSAVTLGGALLIALPGGNRNVEVETGGYGDPANE